MTLPLYVQGAWFAGALLFILGLKGMSSPASARKGIVWAGYGMLIAIAGTFLVPGLKNIALMALALVIGGRRCLDFRQEGQDDRHAADGRDLQRHGRWCGGGDCRHRVRQGDTHSAVVTTLAVLGALIGSVSFTGSCVAYAKLQGLLKKALPPAGAECRQRRAGPDRHRLGGAMIVMAPAQPELILVFFAIALILGLIVTLPIGGADMPVVISLFNAFTGLAVGFEGYVLGNPALIIAGIVVGAAGTLLTQLMAKAMNRPISNILFTPMVAAVAPVRRSKAR
jgi:NAD(P) transhydrogenase subunit beta